MADVSYYLSGTASTGAALALGAGAVVLWVSRTRRPEPAPAEPPTAPKLTAGGAEIAGLAAVLVAAVLAVAAPVSLDPGPFGWLSVLALVAAAALRWYRLARPAPPVLDRLTAVLALVPACALLVGAIFIEFSSYPIERWVICDAVGGALALAAGLRWRRTAGPAA
ncbi:hypothetical protein [Dactylosporangium sp. CA-233914]|uniref:hypothetical protein n=1 Tax=Dactylosporangium sp. CA-233914 TaxID=3239934 RepID=UPI003D8A0B66